MNVDGVGVASDCRCGGCLEIRPCVWLRARVTRVAETNVFLCASCLAGLVRVLIGDEARDVERWFVKATLDAANGNKSRAARVLGMSRFSLYRRLSTERCARPRQSP